MKYNIKLFKFDDIFSYVIYFFLFFIIMFFFYKYNMQVCYCSPITNQINYSKYELIKFSTTPIIYSHKNTNFINLQNCLLEINRSKNLILIRSNFNFCTPGLLNKEDFYLLSYKSIFKHPNVLIYNDYLLSIFKNNYMGDYISGFNFSHQNSTKRSMLGFSDKDFFNDTKNQFISANLNFFDLNIIDPKFFSNDKYLDNNLKKLIKHFQEQFKN